MTKNFYLCNVSLENSDGLLSTFTTCAIATSAHQAVGLAKRDTHQILPDGWSITAATAIAIKRKMLEHVAEEVLGWTRP